MFKVHEPLSYNERQLAKFNKARLKRAGYAYKAWDSLRFILVFSALLILIGMVNAL